MFTCCDDPRPMLQERENRFFCANCRHWLESGAAIDEGEGTARSETDADDVGEQERESS